MFTTANALRKQKLIKVFKLAAIIIAVVTFLQLKSVYQELSEKLQPPILPASMSSEDPVLSLQQGWTRKQAQAFHHTSQGTRTITMPASWFLALEKPIDSSWAWLYAKDILFSDNDYLSRFGFVASEKSELNPYGLPAGFAVKDFQNLPGLNGQYQSLGLTCAACHTSVIAYKGKQYIVEGGSANIALDQFNKAIAASIAQTALSAKLPIMDFRFDRFAQKSLGANYSKVSKDELKQQLFSVAKTLAAQPKNVDVVEGFSRLDALNRIGNQVFAINPHRYENYVAPNAPVNYPHLWTSVWFNWVQYDGSIMQPLVRNAGEALGVRSNAKMVYDANEGVSLMQSSVDVLNLFWLEQLLGGEKHPLKDKKFTGLSAPVWHTNFPSIDLGKVVKGRALYQEYCESCHLPSMHSDEIWQHEYWGYYGIETGLERKKTMALKKINLAQLGTDPQQASILLNRRINTSKTKEHKAMGIQASICSNRLSNIQQYKPKANPVLEKPGALVELMITDAPMLSFAAALGAVVEQNIQAWAAFTGISNEDLWQLRGYRPNCLEASPAYKARPLNGAWATTPFLHNGSVPTLYHVLSPVDERPRFVRLGSIKFDPVYVGLDKSNYQDSKPKTNKRGFDEQGYFWLDTTTLGNSNKGHEFSSLYNKSNGWQSQPKGVVGPRLSHQEKMALLEFLKTQ